ncbi:hypothetical protein [Mesorhizobium australicum]|uniref:hypothetical protein n=1 Tax=Mesorhizobium australicum TaxID=536018 RepID=UPI003337BA96
MSAKKPKSEMAGVQAVPDLLFSPSLSINGSITADTVPFVLERLQQKWKWPAARGTEHAGRCRQPAAFRSNFRFQHHAGRPSACAGKTNVYSDGITILAAFRKEARYLTRDIVLLVHERRLETCSSLQIVQEQLELLKTAEKLNKKGWPWSGTTSAHLRLSHIEQSRLGLSERRALSLVGAFRARDILHLSDGGGDDPVFHPTRNALCSRTGPGTST